MRFYWTLALMLWGCSSIESWEDTSPATLDATWQELPAWMAESAPTDTTSEREAISALPEATLVFDAAPEFIPGATETLTVSGATPGAKVFFIVGPFSEDHTCPAALGGLCMDINFSQGRYLGKATANDEGVATLNVAVPNTERISTFISEGYAAYTQALQASPPNISEAAAASVCDPALTCAEVITCIAGLAYPTACGDDNCDASIGACGDTCTDVTVDGGICDVCDGGVCTAVTCDVDAFDVDGDASNGCEAACEDGSVEDACGVCGGDDSSCADCCGVPDGDGSTCDGVCGPCNDDTSCLDACGVPDGDDSSCADCCGVPDGDGTTCDGVCGPCGDDTTCLDACGVPDGDDSSCADCCGVPDGDGTTCDGVCGPCGDDTSCLDDCGVPDGDGTSCLPAACEVAPDIAFIDPSSGCEGTASGDTCSYSCNAGYSASDVATCNDGVWNDPSCVENLCDVLVLPEGVTGSGADACTDGFTLSAVSDSSCEVACDVGYSGGTGVYTCDEDGGVATTTLACTPTPSEPVAGGTCVTSYGADGTWVNRESCASDDSTADSYGDTCSAYYDTTGDCSDTWTDGDFIAADQCCTCGGGLRSSFLSCEVTDPANDPLWRPTAPSVKPSHMLRRPCGYSCGVTWASRSGGIRRPPRNHVYGCR